MEFHQIRPTGPYGVMYLPCNTMKNIAWYACASLSGFYCSMETPIIIRVGTRIYGGRISAVSQEHVHVCRNRLDFIVRDRNWFEFRVRIGNDLVSCGGRKWFGIGCRGVLNLKCLLGEEQGVRDISCWGRHELGFCVGDRNVFGCCLGYQNCLGFSCVA